MLLNLLSVDNILVTCNIKEPLNCKNHFIQSRIRHLLFIIVLIVIYQSC